MACCEHGSDASASASEAARYYSSKNASLFYGMIWGASINGFAHVGVYDEENCGEGSCGAGGSPGSPGDSPFTSRLMAASSSATRILVERALAPRGHADSLDDDGDYASEIGCEDFLAVNHVVDLGAGYGGTARKLCALNDNVKVTCVNISRVENDHNKAVNKAEHLEGRIDVITASFDDVPLADASCDVVVSQDAFLHADDRTRVMVEIARILRPGGRLIFTDIMQSESGATRGGALMEAVLKRLQLNNLGDVRTYTGATSALRLVHFDDRSDQLAKHYRCVQSALQSREHESLSLSDAYRASMNEGLRAWIDAADAGHLAWGYLEFLRV